MEGNRKIIANSRAHAVLMRPGCLMPVHVFIAKIENTAGRILL
jgi:hypothetical protein